LRNPGLACPHTPFADPIPPVDLIRAALDRHEREATLLRRLLRLALRRDREAALLAEQEVARA